MLNKLDSTIEDLIKNKMIKSKWTEIENYGIAEIINVMFQNEVDYGSIGHNTIIENMVLCLNLNEGVSYKHEGDYKTLIKAYIDINNNIIFTSSQRDVYMYETEIIDGEDPRHYNKGE